MKPFLLVLITDVTREFAASMYRMVKEISVVSKKWLCYVRTECVTRLAWEASRRSSVMECEEQWAKYAKERKVKPSELKTTTK
jgi:hypothetical protein